MFKASGFAWGLHFGLDFHVEGVEEPPKGPSTQLSYTLKNSNLHNYYPKPEYPIIGSFGP